jgi:hypothetical protein
MKDLMEKLKSEIWFRPDDGAFRSRLVEIVIDNAGQERAELFSESNCDITVSISNSSVEEGLLRFRCLSDLGEQALECTLAALNHDQLGDLEEQLSQQVALQTPCSADAAAKAVIRKNISGMIDMHQASQKLGCSAVVLKSRIPCTDYTYREIDGKKEILDYFWSKQLIDRLCQIKLNGATAEDLQYIAETCCYGDHKWAEELVASLVRPNFTPKAKPSVPKGVKNQSAKIISSKRTPPHPSRKRQP